MKLFPTFSEYSFKDIVDQAGAITKRFPVAVAAATIMTVLAIYMINVSYEQDQSLTIIGKTLITALIGFFLGISAQLLFESNQIKSKKFLYAGLFLFLILYFFSLPEDFASIPFEFWIGQVLVILGFKAFLFVAPYIRGLTNHTRDNSVNLYTYGSELLENSARAGIYSLIIFILGAILLGTLGLLFDIPFINEKRYMEWFVISFLFVGTLQILGGIPQQFSSDTLKQGVTLFFTKRIALPFIFVYTAILYVYFLLILATGEWPNGMVPWLAMWFSFFSFAAYTAAYPYQKNFSLFKPHYIPYMLVLPIALLFYGILVRINAYGFTVNRYLVLAFGLWILGMVLYYLFSKRKVLGMLPFSLAVITAIISIGPWSVFEVSKQSQLEKLQELFTTHQVIEQAQARIDKTQTIKITNEDAVQVRSIIEYICEYHGCIELKNILGQVYLDAAIKSDDNRYNQVFHILDSLGIDSYYHLEGKPLKYLSLNYDYWQRGGPLAVKGYSKLVSLDMSTIDSLSPYTITAVNGRILLTGFDKEIDITEYLNTQLKEKGSDYKVLSELPEQFTYNKDNISFVLFPEYISGTDHHGLISIQFASALLLIK